MHESGTSTMLLQYEPYSNSLSFVGRYTCKFGVAWWDPVPSVGEVNGGCISFGMDGQVTLHLRPRLLQILCCSKPLPTCFDPDWTTILLHRLVIRDGSNSFWHMLVLLPDWGVVDFTMIKGLSSLITRPYESPWSSHCIASKKGPDVTL